MTQKTRTGLATDLTTNLPDNTTGLITPALLRSTLQDMIDSSAILIDPSNTFSGSVGPAFQDGFTASGPASFTASVAISGPAIFTASVAIGGPLLVSAAASFTASINATGIFTSVPSQFSGGLTGTSTNDSASAGQIGEFAISTIASTATVNISTSSAFNITSLSLTAGDWDVYGQVSFTAGTTTNVNFLSGALSTTSATISTPQRTRLINYTSAASAWFAQANDVDINLNPLRLSLSGTTTVFMVAQGNSSAAVSAYGSMQARRRR